MMKLSLTALLLASGALVACSDDTNTSQQVRQHEQLDGQRPLEGRSRLRARGRPMTPRSRASPAISPQGWQAGGGGGGTVTGGVIDVYVHVINAGRRSAQGNVSEHGDRRSDQRAERGVRARRAGRSTLVGDGSHDERRLVHGHAGQHRRDADEDRAPPGHAPTTSTSTSRTSATACSAGRRSRRTTRASRRTTAS